jgi:glycosyltransferase involved in cell wall biosynthesis/SAM-dependent methyltransferase
MNKNPQSIDFYVAFEGQYRGSRELIKLRQEKYLPYILFLKQLFGNVSALDLGCGRGEWLELLGEYGVLARGIDLSEAMLSICREKGFQVFHSDALAALKDCPDSSIQLITGFHISEHLPFVVLVELVQEAYRALSPGGILILETPNSENLQVASSTFYLDPTHTNPIPSQLLSFLLAHSGFEFNDVVRLNADISPSSNAWITLNDVLKGVSRDYAAIGQKGFENLSAGHSSILNISKESGVSLDHLIERFDKQMSDLHAAMQIARDAHHRVRRLEAPLRGVNTLLKKAKHILQQTFSGKQLLVDISELVNVDAGTGVQRVTRSVLTELLKNPPKGFRVMPVYASTNESGYKFANHFMANLLGQKSIEDDALVQPRAGDVFLGLDLQHHVTRTQAATLAHYRTEGVKVFFVVYDLLPIQFPQFWESRHLVDQMHAEWLKVVIQSDGAICISKTVADELRDWISKNSIPHSPQFQMGWFHLGADLGGPRFSAVPSSQLESELLKALGKKLSFLMVGTLEPRKGYAQVLDAFELLWASGSDVNLIIVGKKGWLTDEFFRKLVAHSELNKRLFWVKDTDDEGLQELYSQCTCLIAASYGEGFGLPLIEAAQKGIPVIARDIPVFHEVAGEGAYYFSGNQPEDLAKGIEAWIRLFGEKRHPDSSQIRWSTWSQSAAQLWSQICDFRRSK